MRFDARGQILLTLGVLVAGAMALPSVWSPLNPPSEALAQSLGSRSVRLVGPGVEVPASERLTVRSRVYVAAYSAIRLGSGKSTVPLATTLSIHNTSEDKALVITRADYFDTDGRLVGSYVFEPFAVSPLGTAEAFVPEDDTRGGSGANFVVEWAGESGSTAPVIEAVMVGALGTAGFSLVSRGQPIEAAKPSP